MPTVDESHKMFMSSVRSLTGRQDTSDLTCRVEHVKEEKLYFL